MAEAYFEADGFVSLWIGQKRVAAGSDFLRDGFGVEYHEPDNQECILGDDVTAVSELVSGLSYSESFRGDAVAAAERLGTWTALLRQRYLVSYQPTRFA